MGFQARLSQQATKIAKEDGRFEVNVQGFEVTPSSPRVAMVSRYPVTCNWLSCPVPGLVKGLGRAQHRTRRVAQHGTARILPAQSLRFSRNLAEQIQITGGLGMILASPLCFLGIS